VLVAGDPVDRGRDVPHPPENKTPPSSRPTPVLPRMSIP
jgi:hypothetical protein